MEPRVLMVLLTINTRLHLICPFPTKYFPDFHLYFLGAPCLFGFSSVLPVRHLRWREIPQLRKMMNDLIDGTCALHSSQYQAGYYHDSPLSANLPASRESVTTPPLKLTSCYANPKSLSADFGNFNRPITLIPSQTVSRCDNLNNRITYNSHRLQGPLKPIKSPSIAVLTPNTPSVDFLQRNKPDNH